MTGAALAAAAESLLGTPFRLHGRDPQRGLDCVGLLEAALRMAGHATVLPRGYTLRLADPADWLPLPGPLGFGAASGAARAGDALLLRTGPGQAHVVIVAADGAAIHAHAGLRRVVKAPRGADEVIIAHWRLEKETD
ncbi:NlpC/P60 family protein [Parablastomonas sp. CN1-191]|uniref:NlpC/P60 family protein n=1 Tax=Parablastomonas sp. CN1-191 TaxID=3400908 RepID=UPI003BF8E3D7